MQLFDTHAHLYLSPLKENINDILDRAKSNNVAYILNVGIDVNTSIEALNLANQHDFIFATFGIHPNHLIDINPNTISEITEIIKHKKIIAIGEIGLDYYWNKSNKDEQQEVFISLIEIAKKHNLPIIIHSRDADSDMYSILKTYALNTTCVMHCFSGDKSQAKKYLDLGFYLSFTGIITFKNAITVKESLQYTPLDRILLETDCPYLAPHPYRGKTNEPSYLMFIASEVAKIKNCSLEEVASCTTENAIRFFSLKNHLFSHQLPQGENSSWNQ